MRFQYIQLVHAIPNSWKSNIQQMNSNIDILTVKDHHIIKKFKIITVGKLHSKNYIPFSLQMKNINYVTNLLCVNVFQMKS